MYVYEKLGLLVHVHNHGINNYVCVNISDLNYYTAIL